MEISNKKITWTEGELRRFQERLMRRVYFAWLLRKVLVPAFVIMPLAAFLLISKLSEIALRNIAGTLYLKLADFNVVGLFNYFINTIRFTELDSLLILTSSLLLAAFFGRKLIKDVYFFWFTGPLLRRYSVKERHL